MKDGLFTQSPEYHGGAFIKLELTQEQYDAIGDIVSYILCNEQIHYEECKEEGEDVEFHIYQKALKLQDI
jgi:hypothetical protein